METKSDRYLRTKTVQLHGALGSGKSNLYPSPLKVLEKMFEIR